MVVIIRFEDDGNAAEDDGDPRHVERKRIPLQQAADDGDTGDHEEGDVLFDAAQFQQLLQFLHEIFHNAPLSIPYGVWVHYTHRVIGCQGHFSNWAQKKECENAASFPHSI